MFLEYDVLKDDVEKSVASSPLYVSFCNRLQEDCIPVAKARQVLDAIVHPSQRNDTAASYLMCVALNYMRESGYCVTALAFTDCFDCVGWILAWKSLGSSRCFCVKWPSMEGASSGDDVSIPWNWVEEVRP